MCSYFNHNPRVSLSSTISRLFMQDVCREKKRSLVVE